MAPRRREVEEILGRLGAAQHGVATRVQLLRHGLPECAVDGLVRVGRLVPVARGIYRVGPLPLPRGPEVAAVFAAGPGARVSHRSAARLQGLTEPERSEHVSRKEPPRATSAVVPTPIVEVSVPRKRRRRIEGVRIHRVRDLREDEVSLLDGIPVTTPARTLLDIAEELGSREVEKAYANALRRKLVTPEAMRAMVERHPDHRGAALWRRLLAEEGEPAFTRSDAEEKLLGIARAAGLPRPEVNVRVLAHEVDFLWRAARLVVEVDGYAYHGSRHNFAADRRRDAELAAGGYRVLRFTWGDLTEQRLATVVRLAQALVR